MFILSIWVDCNLTGKMKPCLWKSCFSSLKMLDCGFLCEELRSDYPTAVQCSQVFPLSAANRDQQ